MSVALKLASSSELYDNMWGSPLGTPRNKEEGPLLWRRWGLSSTTIWAPKTWQCQFQQKTWTIERCLLEITLSETMLQFEKMLFVVKGSIWSVINFPENRNASVITSGRLPARRSSGWSSYCTDYSSTADRGKQPPDSVWTQGRAVVIKSSFPERDLFNHRSHYLPERFEDLGDYRLLWGLQRNLPLTWEFFQLPVPTSGSRRKQVIKLCQDSELSSGSIPLDLPSCSCSCSRLRMPQAPLWPSRSQLIVEDTPSSTTLKKPSPSFSFVPLSLSLWFSGGPSRAMKHINLFSSLSLHTRQKIL